MRLLKSLLFIFILTFFICNLYTNNFADIPSKLIKNGSFDFWDSDEICDQSLVIENTVIDKYTMIKECIADFFLIKVEGAQTTLEEIVKSCGFAATKRNLLILKSILLNAVCSDSYGEVYSEAQSALETFMITMGIPTKTIEKNGRSLKRKIVGRKRHVLWLLLLLGFGGIGWHFRKKTKKLSDGLDNAQQQSLLDLHLQKDQNTAFQNGQIYLQTSFDQQNQKIQKLDDAVVNLGQELENMFEKFKAKSEHAQREDDRRYQDLGQKIAKEKENRKIGIEQQNAKIRQKLKKLQQFCESFKQGLKQNLKLEKQKRKGDIERLSKKLKKEKKEFKKALNSASKEIKELFDRFKDKNGKSVLDVIDKITSALSNISSFSSGVFVIKNAWNLGRVIATTVG